MAADPATLAAMELQPMQAVGRGSDWTVADWAKLVRGSAYSEMLMDGATCLGAGGFWLTMPGQARAWACISPRIGRWGLLAAKRQMDRGIARAMIRLGLRRIEMTVREDFGSGHRFARALGFEPEGIMRRYDADGTNHVLYSRLS